MWGAHLLQIFVLLVLEGAIVECFPMPSDHIVIQVVRRNGKDANMHVEDHSSSGIMGGGMEYYGNAMTSDSGSDYGWRSYYGHNIPVITMDPEIQSGYLPGPPPIKFYKKPSRPKRPKNLLQLLQEKAGHKFKSFSSLLKGVGMFISPPTPSSTSSPPVSPQPTMEGDPNNNVIHTTPPPPRPALELLVQLAPTLSKIVDTVGNAVGGEGSLLALKRDAVVARLKYKKALFVDLPESLIVAKYNLPAKLFKGKKTLLDVVGSLKPTPSPDMLLMNDNPSINNFMGFSKPTTHPEFSQMMDMMEYETAPEPYSKPFKFSTIMQTSTSVSPSSSTTKATTTVEKVETYGKSVNGRLADLVSITYDSHQTEPNIITDKYNNNKLIKLDSLPSSQIHRPVIAATSSRPRHRGPPQYYYDQLRAIYNVGRYPYQPQKRRFIFY